MTVVKELRTVFFGGIGGVLGVAASKYFIPDFTFIESTKVEPSNGENVKPIHPVGSSGDKILRYGAPRNCMSTTVLEYENHVLEYDPVKRVPKWVAEHISENKAFGNEAKRKLSKFGSDPQVPLSFTSENKDFWGTGWSRGHMAPAGNNKHSQTAMDHTFFLTNIVPQDIDNNGNYWNRLEVYCRDLTKQYSDVYVISGPLWLPELEGSDPMYDPAYLPVNWKYKSSIFSEQQMNQIRSFTTRDVSSFNVNNFGDGDVVKNTNTNNQQNDKTDGDDKKRKPKPPRKFVRYQVLGKNNVAVPTHLFKIILVEDSKLEKPMLGAFIIPNKPIQNVPLQDFEVEMEEVEKHVGVRFHHQLDRENVNPLCLGEGCKLNDYHEFQDFYWNRQMSNPWNIHNLERDWKVVCERGLKTEKLEKLYLTKKQEFLEKANKKVEKKTVISEAGDKISGVVESKYDQSIAKDSDKVAEKKVQENRAAAVAA